MALSGAAPAYAQNDEIGRPAALSLGDAVATALTNHPRVLAARAARDAARQGVAEQRAELFPTVSLSASGGYTYREDNTTRRLAGLEAGGTGDPGADDLTTSLSARLTQPVYDFGGIGNRIDAAQAQDRSRYADLLDTESQIAIAAVEAYITLANARSRRDLADAAILRMRAYVEDLRILADGGAGDPSAVTLAENLVQLAEASRLEFAGEVFRAEADWRQAVGTPPPGADLAPVVLPQDALPQDLEALRMAAEDSNPAIASAKALAESRAASADAARSTMLPRLDAEISYSDDQESEALGGDTKQTQALLRLSWQLNSGGRELAQLRRARAQRIEAEQLALARQRIVDQQIERSFANWQTAQALLQSAEMRVEATQRSLGLFERQFEGGQRTALDLLNGENEVLNARVAVLQAELRLAVAQFRLLASTGGLKRHLGLAE